MIKSQILNEYVEKGIEKGKKEYIKEGKKEGRLERLKKDIAYVLRARFNRVPRRISNKIKTIKEETKLEHLLKLAVLEKDLGEFEKNLE